MPDAIYYDLIAGGSGGEVRLVALLTKFHSGQEPLQSARKFLLLQRYQSAKQVSSLFRWAIQTGLDTAADAQRSNVLLVHKH